MKKRRTLLFFLVISFCTLTAQTALTFDYQGRWATTFQEVYNNLDVCQCYNLQLSVSGRGQLGLEILFQTRESEEVPNNYNVQIPMRYQLSQVAYDSRRYTLVVEFLEVDFLYEDDPWFKRVILPGSYQNYLDYIRSLYEHQTLTFELELKSKDRLNMKLSEKNVYPHLLDLQKNGRLPSCEQLKRM